MKPVVRIRHVNFFGGFDDARCRSHVLMDLCAEFEFVFSDPPDIVLVGCYGQHPLPPSNAVKIGYYTENLAPDLVNFDYFFGCEYTDVISHPKYCKRVYGPLPNELFAGCADPELAYRQKTKFCNFVYTHRVPFRERFFKELERYRPIAAPGGSMHNSAGVSSRAKIM